jgi:hypothetical protein
LEVYREGITSILDQFQSAAPNCKVHLINLPPVSEDLNHPINISVSRHNKIIADIAPKYPSVELIDFHAACINYLQENTRSIQNHRPEPFVLDDKNPILQALLLHFWSLMTGLLQKLVLRRSWDGIAKARRRLLLVDDVHINDTAAQLLVQQLISATAAGAKAQQAQ